MTRIRLAIGLVIALISIPTILVAEVQDWYQVAVLVFAQPLDTDEDLIDQPSFAWPSDMHEPFPLPEGQSALYPAYEQLRRSPDFRPLLHLAWDQPIVPGQLSSPYHVQGETVEGTVLLERGESLYAIVDMEYHTVEGVVHRLREKRQLKFNETHYLDHPAFGVLIRVSPRQSSP